MMPMITSRKEDLRQEYQKRLSLYERLALNIQQALTGFLDEKNLSYFGIPYRIKDFESFFEKFSRKGYKDPFTDTEDICGLRVICFYPADVEIISNIIKIEFVVHESQDKSELLGTKEFGYRSVHFLVTVPDNWLKAPNYRNLGNIKAEIQIRTILMHAWAELSHQLAYKKHDEIPHQLERSLSMLAAKFEDADDQIGELRSSQQAYTTSLVTEATRRGKFDENADLNLDTLEVFLNYTFSLRKKNDRDDIRNLLTEITRCGVNMKTLVSYCEREPGIISEVESQLLGKHYGIPEQNWTQVAALRIVLYLAHPGYFECAVGDRLECEQTRLIKSQIIGPWQERYRNS